MSSSDRQGDRPSDDDLKFPSLEQLTSQISAEKLESGVKVSTELLENLEILLSHARDNAAVARFLTTINALQNRSNSEQTVVGVVGSTGSGKSSVINAVIDEERIIPTNCMRACTAVITELLFNTSDDPTQAYRAEIEFISRDDWIKELKHLFGDLSGAGGELSQESAGAEADIAVAWDKLKAIYPELTKSKTFLATSSPTALADDPSVRDYLGNVKTINDESPTRFHEQLRKYIDSKEKTRGRKKQQDDKMEFWPLIKVVRIYLKSDALSTGLVLVDLDLNLTVERSIKRCRDSLKSNIFQQFPRGERAAQQAAAETSAKWTRKKDEGGLVWMTFKATCRRVGSRGFRDFNEELIQPMKTRFAQGWERTFASRYPNVLKFFAADITATLSEFHRKMSIQPGIKNGVSAFSLDLVAVQIGTYSNELVDQSNALRKWITTVQRDANREFTPVIANAMSSMYTHASNEGGTGCYKRCKDAMLGHVSQHQGTMFNDAARACVNALTVMCDHIHAQMEDKVESIIGRVDDDYTNLIIGTGTLQASAEAKEIFRRVLATADAKFKVALQARPVIVKMEPVETPADESSGLDELDDALFRPDQGQLDVQAAWTHYNANAS